MSHLQQEAVEKEDLFLFIYFYLPFVGMFFFSIFQQCVTTDPFLTSQGESTGSGPNSRHCCTTCRACRCQKTLFFWDYFVTKDAGTAVAHLQCNCKIGRIRRNKLPVDVIGASVKHSKSN